VRCAKIGLSKNIGGVINSPSSYFMKSPPEQLDDHEALIRLESFVSSNKESK
jgi:myo-inositol-1-phosphate synthase